MALNFFEKAMSRAVERAIPNASVTLKWTAMYSYDELQVYVGLLLVAPTRWDGLRRSRVALEPQGGGVWFCEVEYAWTSQTQDSADTPPDNQNFNPAAPITAEWSFDGSAQTVHVTQSVQTISKTPRATNQVQDTKQAIGIRYDGIEGCDIFAPKLEISLTLTFAFATFGQVKAWSKITGRTNSAAFLAWDAGELLYLGPSASSQPNNYVKATHKFLAARNLTLPGDKADLTIVPEATVLGVPIPGTGLILPAKKGHEYVWVMYEGQGNPDPGAPWVIPIPHSAYVEQVYRSADFSPLLVGA